MIKMIILRITYALARRNKIIQEFTGMLGTNESVFLYIMYIRKDFLL